MNINLDVIKDTFLNMKRKYSLMTGTEFDENWTQGTFTLHLVSNIYYIKLTYTAKLYDDNSNLIIHESTELIEYDDENKYNRNVLTDYDDVFKQAINSKSFNEIEITVKNKSFISYKENWNQSIMDEIEKTISLEPIRFRKNRYGRMKPWWMEYTEQPAETLVLPESFSLNSIESATDFLKSLAKSSDPNWDCSFITIHFSGSQITSFTREIYIFESEEQRQNDKPHLLLCDYVIDATINILSKQLINNNLWSSWRLFFKTYPNGSYEIFLEDGREIVPLFMKNGIKASRLKVIESRYASNNQLFKENSFKKEELLQSIFDNTTIDNAHYSNLVKVKFNRDKKSLKVTPEYITTQYSQWLNNKGEKLYGNISEIYNQSLLFQTILNLIHFYYPEEKDYWQEFSIEFYYQKMRIQGGLFNNYVVEFPVRSESPISGSILEPIQIRETKGLIAYSYEEYEAVEKQLDEEEAQAKLNKDKPVTAEYLLQNIFNCVAANAPDNFATVKAYISCTEVDGSKQFSGSYYYTTKGWFSSEKPLKPGEYIYPLNVTSRLLDEFYTQESKDWSLVILTFKNDGTCNVKIKK